MWQSGNISAIYYDAKENVDLVNIKKALAALVQHQSEAGDYTEVHPAGECRVSYEQTEQTGTLRRLKRSCAHVEDANTFVRPEVPLQANIQSYRSADYEFVGDGTIREILARDYFRITMQGNDDVGGAVDSSIKLHREGNVEAVSVASESSPKEFLAKLSGYKSDRLVTGAISVPERAEKTNVKKLLGANVDRLTADSIGSAESAKAFLDILVAASTATKDELVAVLKAKKLARVQVR